VIQGQTLKVIDIDKGECEHTFDDGPKHIRSVYMFPDDTKIITLSYDNKINIYSLKTGAWVGELTRRNKEYVHQPICISGNGNKVLAFSYDRRNEGFVWDLFPMDETLSPTLQQALLAHYALIDKEEAWYLITSSPYYNSLFQECPPALQSLIRPENAVVTWSDKILRPISSWFKGI
jgi:WD40 repeat protein